MARSTTCGPPGVVPARDACRRDPFFQACPAKVAAAAVGKSARPALDSSRPADVRRLYDSLATQQAPGHHGGHLAARWSERRCFLSSRHFKKQVNAPGAVEEKNI
eukprot:TRINITY_DN14985_c0_g1_i1.p2 TRINITY_DN14985_c0_g1~~TRINITY_DN14985_c0_g1_i1.p2  ORF type:complete len:105 (-),score=14.17 TRINITY_DN14985_c0_g1_i1:80-394(-)